LIQSCRALVLPSFAEGLPVVIMEALALGRPVISTYVAAIPELVQPGVSGWLVPPSSVEALAAAIREALDAPVERLERMGRAGALRVAERHDAAVEAAKLVTLFRQVIAPPALPRREADPVVESAGLGSGSPSTHFAGSRR
jgi:glycosyltransferase involved in cell wall biosynthesis